MKVEDIQIGDWVQNPLGAPYQVLAIHFYKINGDGDGYYGIHLKNKGAEARLEIYDLHPVPLTPEILEKNFEKKIFYGMYDDFFDLEIREYYEGVYAVTYHYCEFPQADQIVLVSFIHELQHTLRLLNIEKEIVL